MTNCTEHARLQGRRIVITGAASGVGRCTAQLFAAQGAAVTLLDSNHEALMQVAQATGGHAFAVDITDETAVTHAIAQGAAVMGGIDGVANIAGMIWRGAVAQVSVAHWRRVLDVNLTGAYIVVRSCLPWLTQARAATIVNVGSGQAIHPTPNRSAYAASKAGVVTLTRALAIELAPDIRVNSVNPGLVDTPMAAGESNVHQYPLNRMAQPVEIAHAILFLTSAESSYITGTALAVDGGRTLY